MFTIKRILVPIDFSEVAHAAISVALQLASDNDGCEIIGLYVQPDLDTELERRMETAPHGNAIMNEIEGHEASIRAAFAQERDRATAAGKALRPSPVRTYVSGGDWLEVCLQIIDDSQVDLVVAGTHGGAGGLKGLLVGSDTERLVHKAPCSVFVVKPAGYPYLRD